MTDWDQVNAVVCTSYSCDTEEELLGLVDSVRNVSKPSGLKNEDVYISQSEPDDFKLVYSTDDPEEPDTPHEYTAITANTIEEQRLHVHSVVQQDLYREVITTHQQMLASAGKIDVGYIATAFRTDRPLSDILSSIDFFELNDNAPQVDAINFVENELDMTITNHPIETLFSVVEPDIEPIEASKLETRIEETVEKGRSQLIEVVE